MQFIDLKAQYQKIQSNIQERINRVLEHGIYIMGPEIHELELQLANFAKAKHCITVGNGTDALMIAMMALNIAPGDEVITTPFTFIATAEMIAILGAKPVFVDVDPKTYNINPALIEKAITPKTKAILPVNIYGQCADYEAIKAIAKQYNLAIVEDAAQSFGSTYKNRPSCSLGTISCTSFFPAKPLGCYGDGGACFTDDDVLADQMRKIRNHGQSTRYHHVTLGLNSRLDSLQAAVLLAKLEIFDNEVKMRQKAAKIYDEKLRNYFEIPFIEPHNQSVYAQYTIQVDSRTQMQQHLQEQGIPTAVHYPVPLHKQPVFQHLSCNQSFPVSENLSQRVMSLPFHPYLHEQDIEKITDAVIATMGILSEVV